MRKRYVPQLEHECPTKIAIHGFEVMIAPHGAPDSDSSNDERVCFVSSNMYSRSRSPINRLSSGEFEANINHKIVQTIPKAPEINHLVFAMLFNIYIMY